MTRTLTLAHSPDSDDAFMFYALAAGKVGVAGVEFRHELADIETLNRWAREERYDVTAISYHAWPHLRDRYLLLTAGSSVGDGYGPVLVARRPVSADELPQLTVAVAGTMTTSFLVLKLYGPAVRTVVVPFDRIQDEVARGAVDAGVLIHEGQLTYADAPLLLVEDLGAWWKRETGLPLPLGGNAVRRSLEPEVRRAVGQALRESVEYALAHRAEAMEHARRFARGLDDARADRFVGMYVNDFTRDLGPRGRQALELLYRRGHEAGLLPDAVSPEFAA